MDRIIKELSYIGTIFQGNYRKMTISWSFSYNYFVKFHGKTFGSPNMTMLYLNLCYNKVCYKETALYLLINSYDPNKMYMYNVTEYTNIALLYLMVDS